MTHTRNIVSQLSLSIAVLTVSYLPIETNVWLYVPVYSAVPRPTVNSDTTVSSTSSGGEGNCPLDVVLVTLSCFLSVLVALVVGVVLGWCVGRRVRRERREGREREIRELSDRRMSEKELVKQECIYDEPCLTGTAISVAPNQAYGHINIRSNQTN